MKNEKTQPDAEIKSKNSRPAIIVCSTCAIIFVLMVITFFLTIFLLQKACERQFDFEVPEIFKPEAPETPQPLEPMTPEEMKNLPEFLVVDESRDALKVGVGQDISTGEIEKLNRYLASKYFAGEEMFNIAYVNKESPESGEVIAVYNFNRLTGTDSLTILDPEPGARYPLEGE